MDFLTDMAAKRAELAPGKVAFVDHDSGRAFTFRDIDDRANRLGNLLLKRGLVPGDRIAVICRNHPDFFVLLFAAQKTGLLLLPLNWRQPSAELKPLLAACRAKLLFSDGAFAQTARELARADGLDILPIGADGAGEGNLDDLLADADSRPAGDGRVSSDAPWYLLHTSGTTGLPKAVIQTAGMAYANMINYCQPAGLAGSETGINFLPLFHTAGINLPTLPLFLNGGSSVVLRTFDADTVLDLIGAGRVSCFFGVPAVYQALALSRKIDATDFSAVRSLGCGGAPVPEHLLASFQARGVTICNGMGMTETGPTIFLMDKEHAALKIGSVGKAQLLTDVRLVAADGRVVTGAGEGEAQFRGANVTPGYMDDTQATDAAFTPDGWLKSGDVARRDEDGYYYIVDRIKDMYISGGENVYPAEVEKVLESHPAILEAAVVSVPDGRWGEAGAAFLIARPGESIDTQALPGWCRSRLAAYKIPRSFTVIADLPRTAAGKVRKPAVRHMFLAETTSEDA